MSTPSSEHLDGRLTSDKLQAIVAAICHTAGLNPAHAELIKFTNNAVFRLRTADVVIRIAGSTAVRERIHNVVRVATWLADHDLPAVRLRPDINQPVHAAGHLATIWQYVPATGPRPDGAALADLVRHFHSLPAPPFSLPPWQPLNEIRTRLAEPEDLNGDDHAFLLRCCDDIEAELADLTYVLPNGAIHGDPFLGNLIPGHDGPVLCDFDGTRLGPREWDLTPMAVGRLRFNYPIDDYTPFARRYGFDVTTWDGFPILRRLRELQLVTSVIPILRSNPAISDQWEYRLRTFRQGDVAARWDTYRAN